MRSARSFGFVILAILGLLHFSACAKNDDAAATQQAAVQIQAAFSNAEASKKQTADAISDSMRKGEYDTAAVSLTALQNQMGKTPEQLQAIQEASVALKAELIRKMNAGDPKAKASFELLRELSRN